MKPKLIEVMLNFPETWYLVRMSAYVRGRRAVTRGHAADKKFYRWSNRTNQTKLFAQKYN